MKKALFALVALPFLAGIAMAKSPQPMHLTNTQMDHVTGGWSLTELDPSNTSWTEVSVYSALPYSCSSCFLTISSSALSVASKFGPSAP